MTHERLGSLRIAGVVLLGLAFTLWSWLTLSGRLPSWVDSSATGPHLTEDSAMGQVQEAVALLSHPLVVTIALAGLAWWSFRRRLRNIAGAIVIGVVVAWPVGALLKLITARPRPQPHVAWSLTTSGWSYPSDHMSVITAAAILVIATTTTTRQPRAAVFAWRVIGVAAMLLVGWNRWITNSHWMSDIVGGWLLGAFGAAAGLVLTGVRMVPTPAPKGSPEAQGQICAVIHNPTKITDMSAFRRHVEWEMRRWGWYDALWLQTTRDDPGAEMARQAIDAGVGLVIVAGGDGTVRVVCSELANSGIPVAIIPAGTGNLLARNLGIPLDESSALDVAFEGYSQKIDMVHVTADSHPIGHFLVMAGVGVDARIMSMTRPELKRTMGSAAYFIAAAQQLNVPPVDMTYRIDDQPPVEQPAALAVMGNVGVLQANIVLFPHARPNDGLLDIIFGSPRRARDWAPIVRDVVLRRKRRSPRITQGQGKRVSIELAEPTPFELDGDACGRAVHFVAEVDADSLLIQLPRPLRRPPARPQRRASGR